MTPHGPDTTTYESAILPRQEQPAHLGRDTLAFMFETSLTPRVTPAALGSTCIDRDYYKCWLGLKSHFDRNWFSSQNSQRGTAVDQQGPNSKKTVDALVGSNGRAKQPELELAGR